MVEVYTESHISDTEVIRIFSSDVESEELKWHWDEEDRIIESIGKTDWKFQFDNQLPINIEGKLEIKKGVWHRLIKGTHDIKIKIKKIS
jgi:hypothetical protein